MPLPPKPLVDGVYDEPVTHALDARIQRHAPELVRTEGLDSHHSAYELARVVHERLAQALASLPAEDRVEQQRVLVNRVLALVQEGASEGGADVDDHVHPPARKLVAVMSPPGPLAPLREPVRPTIALATSDLLVNGRHDVSLGRQVKLELASADEVDLLCSFVKWSGVRHIVDELHALRARGGRLRILTTVYMGATERVALDRLVELGADVRVSYDTETTRLHAKAWLFHRRSGFSTAFVGSSNLSAAAMSDGAEWNVRLSRVDNRTILEKFEATFAQYWADPSFRPYAPDEFGAALTATRRHALQPFLIFDVQPRPHQQEMLDDLAAERAHGHLRNLVVAATGTGKTIVAALDYKRLRAELPRANLLFVAHRREILAQSHSTFQVVLRDGGFGERLVAGARPEQGTHVFASIQSLHAERLSGIPSDHFDVVIIDEFHHAAADTYETLLTHLKPRVLIGLTATPERADGRDILSWFQGRIASELRLWKALDQGLLSPFQYFGIGGAPSLAGLRWTRGRYDPTALGNVYTADHIFARRVVQEVVAKVGDVTRMRALGFCVDVAHAGFMARQFNDAGLTAAVVTSETPERERGEHLQALRAGDLRCLFSVDLFNEGVDLPDVDTVIFLRPTESATIFLQQLGRGLRKSERKECLTVLDFIGDAHRQFRFDLRYRAIVGGTRRGIARDIEAGFPSLPSGCAIYLDRQAQEAVLANVRGALGQGLRVFVEDLRALIATHGTVDLATFLRESGVELEDLYANERSWTKLQRAAGVPIAAAGVDDVQIERALSRMLHLDDAGRLSGIAHFLASADTPLADAADPIQRCLFVLLGYVRRPYTAMQAAWNALWASPLRAELVQLVALLDDRRRALTLPLSGRLAHIPLQVHGTYSLDEVLAAFDERTTKGGVLRIQAGVHRIASARADLLFVTLEKSERDYSPTTLYKDYPLSPDRFHWESQSNAHAGTPAGQRYLAATRDADDQVLMFVRTHKKDARGETMPYTLIGRCFYDLHRGERPMQVEWTLEHAMPAGLYQESKVAAG